jgi:riboflavin synthase alpha subunit
MAQKRTVAMKGASLTVEERRKRTIAMKILAATRKWTQATKLLAAMKIHAVN